MAKRPDRKNPNKQRKQRSPSPPDSPTGPQLPEPIDTRVIAAILAGLLVVIAICYLPLMRYFFAQDDFMLIYASTYNLGEELAKTFGPVPYHFRPLTEYLYFAGTYGLFGLDPVPYHIMSLLVHLCNTLLMYGVLRGFRITVAPALVSTALFGLSVAFFHIIGWITCIQQLVPETFILLSLLFVARGLKNESAGPLYLSAGAYILALFSGEQSALLPGAIALIVLFGLAGGRLSIRDTVRRTWPHFVILILYIANRVFWKGMPSEGRAKFEYGSNIFDNLVTYLGASYDFWPNVIQLITFDSFKLRISHIILAALVIHHLRKRRYGAVFFGLAFILAMIAPTLFLVRHYFYYHTYASAFGARNILPSPRPLSWLSRICRSGRFA
jgi:hypothetical protein